MPVVPLSALTKIFLSQDVKLVFENAFEYNPIGASPESDQVRNMAKNLEAVFEGERAGFPDVESPKQSGPSSRSKSRSKSRSPSAPKKSTTGATKETKYANAYVPPPAKVFPSLQEQASTSEHPRPRSKRSEAKCEEEPICVTAKIQTSKDSTLVAAGHSIMGLDKHKRPGTTNQDFVFLCECQKILIAGCFDGHGPIGEICSRLGSRITKMALEKAALIATIEDTPMSTEVALTDALAEANSALLEVGQREQSYMECIQRGRVIDYGTTATAITIQGHDLTVASLGDCRCVLIERKCDGWHPRALTEDHRAGDPRSSAEGKRVTADGGEVFKDTHGIWRVKPPEAAMTDHMRRVGKGNGPGTIQLSRSLGHQCFSKYGVSPVPDVKHFPGCMSEGNAIVVCSDGVWDVLSNQDVADIIVSYALEVCASHDSLEQRVRAACNEIVRRSRVKKEKLPKNCDDVTCLVVVSSSTLPESTSA